MFRLSISKYFHIKKINFYLFKNYSIMNANYFSLEKIKDDIILTPKEGHNSVLIWMHGLGDSALGYQNFFDSPYTPIPKKMKVVLLTAPRAAVTINMGMVMNSWYDIKSFNKGKDSVEQSDVIKNSERINKVLESEVKLLNGDYNKVFIGGFSQGACMALHVALTNKNKMGGLLILSGLLFTFTAEELVNIQEPIRNTPIFIGHGSYDEVIPEPLAKYTYKPLFEKNFSNLVYKSYPEPHTISEDEVDDLRDFLSKFI
jgi:predicted esterase